MWIFKELPGLIYLNLLVAMRKFIEECRVAKRFYCNRLFFKIDLCLKSHYFLKSPFKISKDYLLSIGVEDPYTYGETPLTTLEKISTALELNQDSVLLDLGSSTGRTSFWIHCFTGAKVIGVEHNPIFVNHSQAIKNKFSLEKVMFVKDDMCNLNFSDSNAVYFYGTCFDEPFIKMLLEKLKQLPSGSRVASVSYPLTDYTRESVFKVTKELTLPFSWGKASVYIQEKL